MTNKLPVNYALGALYRDVRVGRELASRIIKERRGIPFKNPQELSDRVEGVSLQMAKEVFSYELKSQSSIAPGKRENGSCRNLRKLPSNKAEARAARRRECKVVQPILEDLYAEKDRQIASEKHSIVEIFRADLHLIVCEKCSELYPREPEQE
jgi:hypothetical protein